MSYPRTIIRRTARQLRGIDFSGASDQRKRTQAHRAMRRMAAKLARYERDIHPHARFVIGTLLWVDATPYDLAVGLERIAASRNLL